MEDKLIIEVLELFNVPPRWLFLKITTREGIIGWGEPIIEGKADGKVNIVLITIGNTSLPKGINTAQLKGKKEAYQKPLFYLSFLVESVKIYSFVMLKDSLLC